MTTAWLSAWQHYHCQHDNSITFSMTTAWHQHDCRHDNSMTVSMTVIMTTEHLRQACPLQASLSPQLWQVETDCKEGLQQSQWPALHSCLCTEKPEFLFEWLTRQEQDHMLLTEKQGSYLVADRSSCQSLHQNSASRNHWTLWQAKKKASLLQKHWTDPLHPPRPQQGTCIKKISICLVSVLVSCSFTCYTMLLILILLRLATYILNSHCRAYTCMYNIYLSCPPKKERKKELTIIIMSLVEIRGIEQYE